MGKAGKKGKRTNEVWRGIGPRELCRIIIGYQSATSRMTEKGFPPVDRRDRIDAVATGSKPAKSFYPVIFGDSIHLSYAARGERAAELSTRPLVAQSAVAGL